MKLEQVMYQPQAKERQTREGIYTTKDLGYLSASVLYTGDHSGFFNSLKNSVGRVNSKGEIEKPKFQMPKIKPSGYNVVIPYGNLGVSGLKDIHDTFKVDRYGNLYKGHTTFNNDFHINTDPLKSRKDKILKK